MDLNEARNKIDVIDDEMTRLFTERMAIAREIAAYKSEHKLPVFDRERERAVINRIEDKVGPELESYANVLYSTLMDVSVDESKMKKVKAIIQSMTPAERQNPDSIKGSHKKRIAAGSGTTIQDVNSLLKQFAQVREMMSRMSNIGKRGFRMPF